jgi:hypothetical protein
VLSDCLDVDVSLRMDLSQTIHKVVQRFRRTDFINMNQNELQHFLAVYFYVDIFYHISHNQADYSLVLWCDTHVKTYKTVDEAFVDYIQWQTLMFREFSFTAEINKHDNEKKNAVKLKFEHFLTFI